jgi:hypothetical protein
MDEFAEDPGSGAAAIADAVAADAARLRFRRAGVRALDPDARIVPILAPGEHVVAVRRSATLRPPEDPEPEAGSPASVDVYVTTGRLVFAGPEVQTVDLNDLDQAVLWHERLLLVFRDGRGLVLDVDRPRLLRVEIAAARAARR